MKPLPLTISRKFIQDFSDATPPSFGIGIVESDGIETGFLAARPSPEIPAQVLASGIGFGHRLSAYRGRTVCEFMFNFYDHALFAALVNPASPIVRHVLKTMVDRGDYIFFILGESGRASAFRSELGSTNIAGIADNLPKMLQATTTNEEYEEGLKAYTQTLQADCKLLNWVCRDDPEYANLKNNPVILPPV